MMKHSLIFAKQPKEIQKRENKLQNKHMWNITLFYHFTENQR